MEISGTLHLYSGSDEEMFFVFDDDIAQRLQRDSRFDRGDRLTRRAWVSVGSDSLIKQTTFSFSKKQTEIKASLCKRTTSGSLGALSGLYKFFAPRRGSHPKPFQLLGELNRIRVRGRWSWELKLSEPAGLEVPPGLSRRTKRASPTRRNWDNRRRIVERDLKSASQPAEQLCSLLAQAEYPQPRFLCSWRNAFLDSEHLRLRQLGLIADIDVWNVEHDRPELLVEVKCQKVVKTAAAPVFFLSGSEWRSSQVAHQHGLRYEIWLLQYQAISQLKVGRGVRKLVFDSLDRTWLSPDGYVLRPPLGAASQNVALTSLPRR